jgi:hypothetical protein
MRLACERNGSDIACPRTLAAHHATPERSISGNPTNPNGQSVYPAEFTGRYFKAQAARMNRLIEGVGHAPDHQGGQGSYD